MYNEFTFDINRDDNKLQKNLFNNFENKQKFEPTLDPYDMLLVHPMKIHGGPIRTD